MTAMLEATSALSAAALGHHLLSQSWGCRQCQPWGGSEPVSLPLLRAIWQALLAAKGAGLTAPPSAGVSQP